MSVNLGIVMDPIAGIRIQKDSSFAMLLAAQARGWSLHYMEIGDLYQRDGLAMARSRPLTVTDRAEAWFELGPARDHPLCELAVILMRKDPPVDQQYLYATMLLEMAEADGSLVVNRPAALRSLNEKLYATRFPQCCPPLLVDSSQPRLRDFIELHRDVIVKPLDAMGGASVFRVRAGDPNTGVILETITAHGRRHIMAQRFIPEISAGDKRVLLVDGEPVPYALARVPAEGENRGNLAVGATGHGVALSDHDRWICGQVADSVRQQGLLFVGLDVIGDYLTEINITSPTCIRELDRQYGLDIAGRLMDAIAARLPA